MVLIESDWNLKQATNQKDRWHSHSINRIRLEFKVFIAAKGHDSAIYVLIESDWNLKVIMLGFSLGSFLY